MDTKGYPINPIHSAIADVYEGFVLVCGAGRRVCVCPDETTKKKPLKYGNMIDYHCSSLVQAHTYER